jgi:superfamily I DNA and/or RNA helicase
VLLSCKTHAATDVLLHGLADAQAELLERSASRPDVFRDYIDARVLATPLFRLTPRVDPPAGITPLLRDTRPRMADVVLAQPHCIIAGTPGGVYALLTDKWKAAGMFGHEFVDCLVLDEASQMNLPEAAMAALPLAADGQLIIVGDHRQMPPIVKHDWEREPRRTFQEYRIYQSLFDSFRAVVSPHEMVQFSQSFRLHADMAEFLRREVYAQDNIPFHSSNHTLLARLDHADPFVRAVLDPRHPIVVVVHDEARSQLRNPFEQALIAPLLEALAALGLNEVDMVEHRLGVVVPHRAQRADLQRAVGCVAIRDASGLVTRSAVDTVERFQGDERDAILVSATESDPQYLLVSSKFLLDPRRLTVALSRAKHKLVLVASRSVFNVFSSDEETFLNAQLWKNLLRHTCVNHLHSETRTHDGREVRVEVWGNGE